MRGAHRSRDPGAPPWASPLASPEAAFLALDFETTGLDPSRCRIVEIGAIRFRLKAAPGGCEIVEEGAMASLVDPGVPMPAEARAIHGLRDEDLAGAPSFASLAGTLLALADGATIVAHNAPFDLSFLDAELSRLGLGRPASPVRDTVALSRRAFPGRSSYRLGSIAGALGIGTGSAHRALDDARTCMRVFGECAGRLA